MAGFRQVLAQSRATALGLAILGLFWGGFAPWLPEYQARIEVTDAVLGQLLLLSAAGGMAGMALSARVLAWFRARGFGAVMLPLGVGVALASLLPLLVAGPVGFAGALLAMGFAMACLDMAANVQISEAEGRTGLHLMNFNHAVFSLAFALAALLVGAARRAGASPEIAVPLTALLMLGLAVLAGKGALAPLPKTPANKTQPAKAPLGLVLAGAMLLFAPFVSENAVESWSTFHFERNLGVAAGEGALGPVMFGLMMGLGRLFGQALAARVGVVRLLAGSVVLGALGGAVVAGSTSVWLAAVGVAMIGLGAAVVVPSASSLIGDLAPPEARARALSNAWTLAFTGFFLGPVVMGMIAQGVGLRWGFALIAVLMGSGLLALLLLLRAGRRARSSALSL